MEPAVKPNSIRCDMHPPLSAIMYCDGCKTFLCRICAEVKPGGRVCATCKQPCREPSPEEFLKLVAERKRNQEAASAVKYLEAKQKENAEKAKIDRDARLKAEFAARKATLGQAKPVDAPAAPITNTSSTTPSSDSGTMYDPNTATKPPIERDPIAVQRSINNLAALRKAKSYMLWIGILTILVNGVLYFVLHAAEGVLSLSFDIKPVTLEQHKKEFKDVNGRNMTKDEIKKYETDQVERAAAHAKFKEDMQAKAFKAKLVLVGFLLVGVAMIVLYIMCDDHPKETTMTAFILYILSTVAGYAIDQDVGILTIIIRIIIIVALYNGMMAGQSIQQMREQETA